MKKTREQLIDELDEKYSKMCDLNNAQTAEHILMDNGASEDDSDPSEGMFITMTNNDLQRAINDMDTALKYIDPKNVETILAQINSGDARYSKEYVDGFIEACIIISEEYGIEIEGII